MDFATWLIMLRNIEIRKRRLIFEGGIGDLCIFYYDKPEILSLYAQETGDAIYGAGLL